MQTTFTAVQLKDPSIAEADGILRKCVRCGFCTATCPTYVTLGDERDSPRGRIYMIKNMLESGAKATEETARHVDRCLSCLACMTTCPSGVNYMHLIDQARVHVEKTYDRPYTERLTRSLLAYVMPRPKVFRLMLIAAKLGQPFVPVLKNLRADRLVAMLALAPPSLPTPAPKHSLTPSGTRGRIALLKGCVQSVLDQSINEAATSLLSRLGYEVIEPDEAPCCGSLTHHMGKDDAALASARATIDMWTKANPDHIVITASGCGTTIKDYDHMFVRDAAYAETAKVIAAKTLDITEFLSKQDLPKSSAGGGMRVAYHSACSLQHGQKIKTLPQQLLRNAGFEVLEPAESHLCCGSAGTYNMLQPKIAGELRARKVTNIEKTNPQIIAAGNLGCITQIGAGTDIPIVHTIHLLDWAYGGERPEKI